MLENKPMLNGDQVEKVSVGIATDTIIYCLTH